MIVGSLQIIQGLVLAGSGLINFIELESSAVRIAFPRNLQGWLDNESALYSLGFIFAGVMAVLVSIALLRMNPWAWTLSMSYQVAGLLAALIAYARKQPNFIMMAMGVFMVFYLHYQEVQAVFRTRRGEI